MLFSVSQWHTESVPQYQLLSQYDFLKTTFSIWLSQNYFLKKYFLKTVMYYTYTIKIHIIFSHFYIPNIIFSISFLNYYIFFLNSIFSHFYIFSFLYFSQYNALIFLLKFRNLWNFWFFSAIRNKNSYCLLRGNKQ